MSLTSYTNLDDSHRPGSRTCRCCWRRSPICPWKYPCIGPRSPFCLRTKPGSRPGLRAHHMGWEGAVDLGRVQEGSPPSRSGGHPASAFRRGRPYLPMVVVPYLSPWPWDCLHREKVSGAVSRCFCLHAGQSGLSEVREQSLSCRRLRQERLPWGQWLAGRQGVLRQSLLGPGCSERY